MSSTERPLGEMSKKNIVAADTSHIEDVTKSIQFRKTDLVTDALARFSEAPASERDFELHINLRSRRLSPPKDDLIKTQFIQIARDFIKLDKYMAEFFQNFGKFFLTSDVEGYLNTVQQTVAKRQNTEPASADIGHLGRFCAKRLEAWQNPSFNTGHLSYFPVFRNEDEYIKYLQDGHDVFYWDAIMGIFHDLGRKALDDAHANIMMDVITSTVVHVSAKHRRLLGTHDLTLESSTMDVVIGGIERRIRFLKSVLKANTPSPGDIDLILSATPAPAAEKAINGTHSRRHKSRENSWYGIFACFIGSFMLAIIPGYIGFAKNWKDEEIGDTNDADFWYLVQSSIVTVFGNLPTLLLLEKSDLASPNASVWAAVIVGTRCNIVSIAIYPDFMPGWSALLSFIGQFSSASCVVISTYTAVLEGKREVKEKLD